MTIKPTPLDISSHLTNLRDPDLLAKAYAPSIATKAVAPKADSIYIVVGS